MVDVTLRLHIPSYTPATDDIYIAGDFNGWNASGGKLSVPSGATTRDVVEYKFKMMAVRVLNINIQEVPGIQRPLQVIQE